MSQVGAPEGGSQEATVPPAPAESVRDQATGIPDTGRAWRPAPHKRSTRGGAGTAAGSTPKKAYRPSASSKSRPAGKKPGSGGR